MPKLLFFFIVSKNLRIFFKFFVLNFLTFARSSTNYLQTKKNSFFYYNKKQNKKALFYKAPLHSTWSIVYVNGYGLMSTGIGGTQRNPPGRDA